MATKKRGKPSAKKKPIYLERWLMEQLMFGSGRIRRFTQDSPVLPDVWLEYALDPDLLANRMTRDTSSTDPYPAVNLILTPYRGVAAGEVRGVVRERVEAERKSSSWTEFGHEAEPLPRIIYNQSAVAASLYFEDLVRGVIPVTEWWRRLAKLFRMEKLQDKKVQAALAGALKDPEHPPREGLIARVSPAVLWLIRVAGAIAIAHRGGELPAVFTDPRQGPGNAEDKDWMKLVQAVAHVMKDITSAPEEASVHSVALNRIASPTIFGSTLAVKADAARRLFDISCEDLRWAVIDSGIDATHPAFRKIEKESEEDERATKKSAAKSVTKKKVDDAPFAGYKSRVRATYDFAQIHLLLDPDTKAQPNRVEQLKKRSKARARTIQEQIDHLDEALSNGRSIDWGLIAPLLEIEHDAAYAAHIPKNDHGTHVAGILGANWEAKTSNGAIEDDLIGVCPDIELYDLRILDEKGNGDEFTVMAALQFVRWLNSINDYRSVHGVNMSLSIQHDVANYACGRTPVCDEAARLVSSGVVVVVAAGNQGFRKHTTAEGMISEAYNTISITDPGNADPVITVGATHRVHPHTYGVSYFSSRGPTGDGRLKPDLVAPGEKITAPIPGELTGLKDGTSMAAPHVSGAAALLMARHNELVGHPQRIKQILCDTATDLGRERYFQGAGMLDVLRALQSV
jgi:hypothetical protein